MNTRKNKVLSGKLATMSKGVWSDDAVLQVIRNFFFLPMMRCKNRAKKGAWVGTMKHESPKNSILPSQRTTCVAPISFKLLYPLMLIEPHSFHGFL